MTDFTTIFLGSGFALFIAILAWGDQIRSPRKEILRLEDIFREKFNLSKKNINPSLLKGYNIIKEASQSSFLIQTQAIIEILNSEKLGSYDRQLLKDSLELQNLRKGLENFYNKRYLLTILTTIVLLILGILSISISFSYQMIIVSMSVSYIMVSFIILNIILTYFTEKTFIRKSLSIYYKL
jgi:hypothetical protein